MITQTPNINDIGKWMHDLMVELFPICRSLSGPGNRKSLEILSRTLPLEVTEVPTGTEVFDWTIPDEWIPRDAYFIGPNNKKYASFAENNLHLVSMSEAVDAECELEELLPHIHSIPDQPELIPYITSYYKRNWGFAMPEREKAGLPPGRYQVKIDTELKPGALSYGEVLLPGNSAREILISTYICHPAMANDNLSGVVTAVGLYHRLAQAHRAFSYRFVFVPETIGAIAWLANNQDWVTGRTHAGIVLSCVGDDAPFTYKATEDGSLEVDRIAIHALRERGCHIPFTPVMGSDERQFNSPGFRLPVGMLSRSEPGQFFEYHTSGDHYSRIKPVQLAGTVEYLEEVCTGLEENARIYRRHAPWGEPMLSERGLYRSFGKKREQAYDRATDPRTALMWVLNQCDGEHRLIDIAERSGLPLMMLAEQARRAEQAGVLIAGSD